MCVLYEAAPAEIYTYCHTLALHDARPIDGGGAAGGVAGGANVAVHVAGVDPAAGAEAVEVGAVVGHAVIAGELDLPAADAARGLYDGARDDGHERRAARCEQVVALVEAAPRAGEAPIVSECDPTPHRHSEKR